MPATNFLQHHWDEQYAVFTTNLAIIRQRPSKKAVHDIRVAIKKMKSVVRLFNAVTGIDSAVKPEAIQLFFKICGKFREEEMSLSLLKKILKEEAVAIPSFQKKLQLMTALTRENVRKAAEMPVEDELKALTAILNTGLINSSDELINKKTEELVNEALDSLKQDLEKFSEQAHAIRKKLKELYYWLRQCTVNPFFDERQMKILDKALTALGNWHDYFVLSNKLRKFKKEYLVKKTEEYNLVCKIEEITGLLQQHWLAAAEQKITSLLKS